MFRLVVLELVVVVNDVGKPFTVTSTLVPLCDVFVYVIVPGGASTPVLNFPNSKFNISLTSVAPNGLTTQVPLKSL